jgi:hypothetical protein
MKVGDLVRNKLTGNVALIVELWGAGHYAMLNNGEKASSLYLGVINEDR